MIYCKNIMDVIFLLVQNTGQLPKKKHWAPFISPSKIVDLKLANDFLGINDHKVVEFGNFTLRIINSPTNIHI